MEVPIACEQCGRKHMEYVYLALYNGRTSSTRIAHDLHCPDCSYTQKLNMPPLLLVRTVDGIIVDTAIGKPL